MQISGSRKHTLLPVKEPRSRLMFYLNFRLRNIKSSTESTFEKLFERIMTVVVLEHYWNKSPIFRFTLSALIWIFFITEQHEHGKISKSRVQDQVFLSLQLSQSFESTCIILQTIRSFQFSLIQHLFSLTSRLSNF